MKTILTLLTVLACLQFGFAQDMQSQPDTTANKKPSAKTGNMFIKLQSRNALGMIKPATKNYNFKSMFGTGAELIVGFKLYEKTALGFGLQRTHFFLNQANVEKGLTETYTQPWLSATVTASKKSHLNQNALFIQLSGWKQKSKSVFEYFGRMSLGSFQYKLNSEVFQQNDFPAYGFTRSFDGGISNTAFMMGAGVNYSIPFSKVIFLSSGLEYNYNLAPRTFLYEKNVYTNGDAATYQIELPTPSHFMQLNIGLMYKPNKPCNCKKQKPW